MKTKSATVGRDGLTWIDPRTIKIGWKIIGTNGKEAEFSNPRSDSNPGFTLARMAKLREAIREDGLNQPLEVWLDDGVVKLIAGERRLRSILQLLDEEASCFDINTGQMSPAAQVYAEVHCKVVPCSDLKEAMRRAVLENLTHEHLTDLEVIFQCRFLEEAGYSRKEQAAVFGDKSEAWVSQSHSLMDPERCHPKVLEAMAEGILNRTQAIRFLNIPNDQAEAVLDRAIDYWKLNRDKKEKELVQQREEALDTVEELDASLAAASASGTSEGVTEMRRSLQESVREADAAAKKIRRLKESATPSPSINDIKAAEVEAGLGQRQPLQPKVMRRLADDIKKALGTGEQIYAAGGKVQCNRREVAIIAETLEFCIGRSPAKDIMQVLNSIEDEAA